MREPFEGESANRRVMRLVALALLVVKGSCHFDFLVDIRAHS
jgi:hypothetical protein